MKNTVAIVVQAGLSIGRRQLERLNYEYKSKDDLLRAIGDDAKTLYERCELQLYTLEDFADLLNDSDDDNDDFDIKTCFIGFVEITG